MTDWNLTTPCSAFAGFNRIASGTLEIVAASVKQHMEVDPTAAILIFDNLQAKQIELDLRGTLADVLASIPPSTPEEPHNLSKGPGRPKLGVIAREVTLLPRHWQWLSEQEGGASVALRKLVDDARRRNESADNQRHSREATYRFMHSMAGDQPDFEEAARALFAGDKDLFQRKTSRWPDDLVSYLREISIAAF